VAILGNTPRSLLLYIQFYSPNFYWRPRGQAFPKGDPPHKKMLILMIILKTTTLMLQIGAVIKDPVLVVVLFKKDETPFSLA
jgi:hypothetical protein